MTHIMAGMRTRASILGRNAPRTVQTRAGRHVMAVIVSIASTMHAAAGDGVGGLPPCGYDIEFYVAPNCGWEKVPTFARGVNEAGVAVGYQEGCPDYSKLKGFLWLPDGTVEVIDIPWSHDEKAIDINNTNQVIFVVNSPLPGLGYVPVIWESGGKEQTLELPDWANFSDAATINDAGVVAGEFGDAVVGPSPLAATWNSNGEMTDLSGLFEVDSQKVAGHNNAGVIVGTTRIKPNGPPPGEDYRRGYVIMNDTITLLDVAPGCVNSIVKGVSDAGHVVGFGYTAAQPNNPHPWRGFRWLNGQMEALSPLPGDNESEGLAVNSQGVVIGRSNGEQTPNRAVIWASGGVHVLADHIVNLPGGAVIGTPWAISDSGIIVGSGSYQGISRALRLMPRARPQADVDGDCIVGAADLAVLLQSWGTTGDAADGTWSADLDGDGAVGGTDLGILLSGWTG